MPAGRAISHSRPDGSSSRVYHPYVSHRAHLLPARPTTTTPLLNRLSDPQEPQSLLRRLDFDDVLATRHQEDQIIEVYEKRVNATITRLQALFDRRRELDNLPAPTRAKLHELIDKLEFLQDHIREIPDQSRSQQRWISFGLAFIGQISFKNLGARYEKVVRHVVQVVDLGYLEILKDSE